MSNQDDKVTVRDHIQGALRFIESLERECEARARRTDECHNLEKFGKRCPDCPLDRRDELESRLPDARTTFRSLDDLVEEAARAESAEHCLGEIRAVLPDEWSDVEIVDCVRRLVHLKRQCERGARGAGPR